MGSLVTRLREFVTHPLFISVVLFVVGVTLFYETPEPYTINLVDQKNMAEETHFYDLDQDGLPEEIRVYTSSVSVLTRNRILDMAYFTGQLSDMEHLCFGDVDQDGNQEVILFVHADGYVRFHAYNPFAKRFVENGVPLCRYELMDSVPDYLLSHGEVLDADGNGSNELYVSVITNDPAHPRPMVAYDFGSRKRFISPANGRSILYVRHADADGDGRQEFFCSTFGERTDTSASRHTSQKVILMALTPEMQYKFPPVEIGSYLSYLNVVPLPINRSMHMAVLDLNRKTGTDSSFIALYDLHGNKIAARRLPETGNWFVGRLVPSPSTGRLFVVDNSGAVSEVEKDLSLVPLKSFPRISLSVPERLVDIDRDGVSEMVWADSRLKHLIVTRQGFRDPVQLQLPDDSNISWPFTAESCLDASSKPLLFVQYRTHSYFFSYGRNPVFVARFALLAALFLLTWAFVVALGRLQQYRLKKRYQAERKIKELQLKVIGNRIDPHFSLNLLNTALHLVEEKQTPDSQLLIEKYMFLLRNTIVHADQFEVPLHAELEFTRQYLDLEIMRYPELFGYAIEVAEEVDKNLIIPKMLIQLFVENSLKHGVRPLKTGGRIRISGTLESGNCLLSVTDNGIGRQKALLSGNQGTGKGLHIVDEMLHCFHTLGHTRITYTLEDLLSPGGTPSGTRVTIKIPVTT